MPDRRHLRASRRICRSASRHSHETGRPVPGLVMASGSRDWQDIARAAGIPSPAPARDLPVFGCRKGTGRTPRRHRVYSGGVNSASFQCGSRPALHRRLAAANRLRYKPGVVPIARWNAAVKLDWEAKPRLSAISRMLSLEASRRFAAWMRLWARCSLIEHPRLDLNARLSCRGDILHK